MKSPWDLKQPWFTITSILFGFVVGLLIIIPIEVFT